MANPDGQIYWYSPNPRAILPLNGLYISQSLWRTLRQGRYEVRVNYSFEEVIAACAQPSPGREETWISEEIKTAYIELHRLGYAHSVEVWREGWLAGGLYGVSLGGFFAGESMFSRQRDSSKIALYHLVERLKLRSYQLLDVQFMTDHLRRMGAIEIPRDEYHIILQEALRVHTRFIGPYKI